MEFVIRIYGAPYGFELYEGSAQELNYFQIFDNGSSEPVKMTVHRLNDHQISYNYLRYGYVTSGGRTGSFFGMSIVFNKSYCSEFTRIYQLFEAVYGTIEENAILLKRLPSGQAQYKIGKFSEAQGEITRIKGVLSQNIQDALASSIKPIDFSSSDFLNKELRLPDNVGDESVAEAVNKYSIVSISPVYGTDDPNNGGKGGKVGEEVVRIPFEELMKFPKEKDEILAKATEWSNNVNAFLINLRALQDNNQDVKSLAPRYGYMMSKLSDFATKVETFLNKINNYHKIESSNPYFKEEVQKEVTTAKENVNTLLNSLRLYEITFKGSGTNGGKGGGPSAFEKFIHENKKMLTMAGVVLCLIVGSVTVFNISRDKSPDKKPEQEIDTPIVAPEPKPTATLDIDSLKGKALEKYNAKRYGEAYKDYIDAGEARLAKDCKDECMNEAKKNRSKDAALSYFQDEMAKGGYNMTDQDKREIESRFKKPTVIDKNSNDYKIVLFQNDESNNSKEVTGDITRKKAVNLKCKKGNEDVTAKASNWCVNSNWGANKSLRNPPQFTPQITDTVFSIRCNIDGKTINKTVKCKLPSLPGGIK